MLKLKLEAAHAAKLVVALLPLVCLASAAGAEQHGSCLDSGMKKITVLGVSPISSKPLESREEMSAYLESIRPDVERIMLRRKTDFHTEALFEALRTGEGVSEAELAPGDVIEWMIFRHQGKVAVGPGPYCVASKRSYAAYQIDLVDEEDLGDAVRKTTTTFLIPKICANIALVGSTTETLPKPEPRAPEPAPAAPPAPPPAPPAPPPAPPVEPEPEPEVDTGRDSRWTVRGFPLRMDVDDDRFDTDDGVERSSLTTSGGYGVGFNVEYRPNDRFGLEAGLLYSEIDSMLTFDSPTEWLMDHDSSSLLVLTFGPNFHLTPGKRADFYVGPFVGFASVGNPSYDLGGTVGTVSGNFDDEFVFGGQLGLDLALGDSSWALHFGALYLNLGVGDQGVDLDLNPLIGTIGLAYNF